MLAENILALCLSIVATEIEPGDKVVTLSVAPVMSGSKKLTEVQPGVELTATDVQKQWVRVTVRQDGEEINGWILGRNLVAKPELEFMELTVRFEDELEWGVGEEFQRIDRNSDRQISHTEFIAGTKNETLDNLNQQLNSVNRSIVLQNPSPRTQGNLFWLTWQLCRLKGVKKEIAFKSWKRKPTREEARQMAEEFMKTGDIRRSPLAQQLWDRETSQSRAQRARGMFNWADKNGNGELSRKEFTQALSQPQKGEQGK